MKDSSRWGRRETGAAIGGGMGPARMSASVPARTLSGEVTMIRGVHTMFYTSEPEALRAFLRDKLGFPATDVGDGWLIFDLPEADMGCHPADPQHGTPS